MDVRNPMEMMNAVPAREDRRRHLKAPAGAAAGAADSIASRVKRKAPPPRLLSRPKRSCASYA